MRKDRSLFKLVCITLFLLFFFSCVKSDHFGKSSEKKVLSFGIQGQVGNTIINDELKTIDVTLSSTSNLNEVRVSRMEISSFARSLPDKNTVVDLTQPFSYTIIAEDGSVNYYEIKVKQEGSEPQLENSSFNEWYTVPKGYKEPGLNGNSIWATGNAGSTTLGSPNAEPLEIKPGDYAVKLTTLDLGQLAGSLGQRVAAGTLFTGKFELDISNPLNSTKFGVDFAARPIKFSVKYAYKPGLPYLSKTGEVLNKKDSCDIYVILENKETGTTKRVATAWFRSGAEEIDQFQIINVNFIYGTLPASTPSYQIPTNGIYALNNEKVTHISVVFSSSCNGALFEGGKNSILVIDDFSLLYK